MTHRSLWMLPAIAWLALTLVACVPGPRPSAAGMGSIEVVAVAGPICPVEREPPDPACDPRPVVGAAILVQPADGRDIVVAQARTDEEGRAGIELPAGDYLVVASDVEGLLGRPAPAAVTVVAGARAELTLEYDTGIR